MGDTEGEEEESTDLFLDPARPPVMKYTMSMIMDFMKKECNKKLNTDLYNDLKTIVSEKKSNTFQQKKYHHNNPNHISKYGPGDHMQKSGQYGKDRKSKKYWHD